MKKRLFVLALTGWFYQISAKVVHEQRTYERQEIINDLSFTYKEQEKNNKLTVHWFIDNQEVDEQIFQEKKLKAKEAAWKIKQEAEGLKRECKKEFNKKAKQHLLKKIFVQELFHLEELIEIIKKYKLVPYFVFSPITFACQQDIDQLFNSIIPDLKKLSLQPEEDSAAHNLNELTNKITSYSERLEKFLQETIDNAIERCNDTKVLKKLIKLVESYH